MSTRARIAVGLAAALFLAACSGPTMYGRIVHGDKLEGAYPYAVGGKALLVKIQGNPHGQETVALHKRVLAALDRPIPRRTAPRAYVTDPELATDPNYFLMIGLGATRPPGAGVCGGDIQTASAQPGARFEIAMAFCHVDRFKGPERISGAMVTTPVLPSLDAPGFSDSLAAGLSGVLGEANLPSDCPPWMTNC